MLDSARAPVLEAEVTLIEAGVVRRRVVTDSAGRFALGELTAGPIALRVRRLGYRQQTRDVQPGAGGQSASGGFYIMAACQPRTGYTEL